MRKILEGIIKVFILRTTELLPLLYFTLNHNSEEANVTTHSSLQSISFFQERFTVMESLNYNCYDNIFLPLPPAIADCRE